VGEGIRRSKPSGQEIALPARWCAALVWLLTIGCWLVAPAGADTLRTLDGRTLEGAARFERGNVLTFQQAVGSAVRVPLDQVLWLRFGTVTTATTRPGGPRGGGDASLAESFRGDWLLRDVGRPTPVTVVHRSGGRVTLTAGGQVGERDDTCALFFQPFPTDGEVVARVADIGDGALQAGVMIRSSLDANAAMAICTVATAERDAGWLRRAKAGEPATGRGLGRAVRPPAFVRLTRTGNLVTAAISPDASRWTTVGSESLDLAADAIAGVFVAGPRGGGGDRKDTVKDNKKQPDRPPAGSAVFDQARIVQSRPPEGTGLRGYYFGTDTFADERAARLDAEVNFEWGRAAPVPSVQPDGYTVRWLGRLRPPSPGRYTFYGSAHGSVALWVDDKPVFGPGAKGEQAVDLKGGPVPIRVEYKPAKGDARLRLDWSADRLPRQPVPAKHLFPAGTGDGGDGLLAEYFANTELTGNPVVARTDADVNFDWGTDSPDPLVPSEGFSARWTGFVTPPGAGAYTFFARIDDGARLWVDNELVIDEWGPHSGVEYASKPVTLAAGRKTPVRLEYCEFTGGAVMRLWWQSDRTPKQAIPEAAFSTTDLSAEPDVRIVTRDGTTLSGAAVDGMDDTALRFALPGRTGLSLPTPRIARLAFRPLTPSMLAQLPPNTPGVLLVGGDFFEGQVGRLTAKDVQVDSLIFGPRSFGLQREVAAIVLQDAAAEPAEYAVRTDDGSEYMAGSVSVENGKLVVTDRVVGRFELEPRQLREIRYGGDRARSLTDLSPTAAGGAADDAVQVDAAVNGLPPRMLDASPQRVVAMAGGAATVYPLDGQYKTMLAVASVPAAAAPGGQVQFVALGDDGKELFRSPPRTSTDDPLPVTLKVAGVKQLTLKVEPVAGGLPLPGLWGDPILTKQ